MVDFNDPAWRSPVTGSTKTEILAMRATHRETCKYVNGVMVERYRIADEEHQQQLADDAELARMEQEERDAAPPIPH